MIYKENYKVELEDIGTENKISNKRIVTIMEDVSAAHSASVGYGVENVEETNCAWILLDWKIKIINRPAYNEHIEASTWSRKSDKLCAFRDFELKDKNGNVFAIGTSRWLYMNLERRRPTILNEKMNEIYKTEFGKMVFGEEISKLDVPEVLMNNKSSDKSNDTFIDKTIQDKSIIERPYKIERRDMDINGHLHNVSYIEAAYEIIPDEIYKNVEFNNIRVEYKKEILKEDNVVIKCLVKEDNSCMITFTSEKKLHAVVQLSND